jgi:hypothetical protein
MQERLRQVSRLKKPRLTIGARHHYCVCKQWTTTMGDSQKLSHHCLYFTAKALSRAITGIIDGKRIRIEDDYLNSDNFSL